MPRQMATSSFTTTVDVVKRFQFKFSAYNLLYSSFTAQILLVLFSFHIICCSEAYNIDVESPIVKEGCISSRKTSSGVSSKCYFGYSVALHSYHRDIIDEETGVVRNNLLENVLLVGAPKDKNLQPGVEESGALWRCPVSNLLDDCIQVPTDGLRVSSPEHRNYGVYQGSTGELLHQPVSRFEIKRGQWLGSSLTSQGIDGNVIVCANRYTVRNVNKKQQTTQISQDGHKEEVEDVQEIGRGLLGMCYLLQPNLTLPQHNKIGYENVFVIREAVGGRRLEPHSHFDDHAEHGMCQLGHSVHFVSRSRSVDDNEERSRPMWRNYKFRKRNSVSNRHPKENMNNDVLLGAPGCFTWRGNLFVHNISQPYQLHASLNRQRSMSENSSNRKGGSSSLHKYGKLGYAVTSGNYFSKDQTDSYYASSAPSVGEYTPESFENSEEVNKNHSGRVYMFKMITSENNERELLLEHTIYGQQIASRFGSTLTSLDLDADSLSDIVIGAPFFTHFDTVLSRFTEAGGAVYIYTGRYLSSSRLKVTITEPNDSKIIRIIGEHWGSQFGSSSASLGDINKDGFEDFAIGAPFEGDEGVVYIFLGGTMFLTERKSSTATYTGMMDVRAVDVASQIIRPRTYINSISKSGHKSFSGAFGWSLNGGMDIDNNAYPDLAIGDFKGERAYIYRTRPIIDMKSYIVNHDIGGIDADKVGCALESQSTSPCYSFTTCLHIFNFEERENGQKTTDKVMSEYSIQMIVRSDSLRSPKMSRVHTKLLLLKHQLGQTWSNSSMMIHTFPMDSSNDTTANNEFEKCFKIIVYLKNIENNIKFRLDIQNSIAMQISYKLMSSLKPRTNENRQGGKVHHVDVMLNRDNSKLDFSIPFAKSCGSDNICQSDVRLTIDSIQTPDSSEIMFLRDGNILDYLLKSSKTSKNYVHFILTVENGGESAYMSHLDIHMSTDHLTYVGYSSKTIGSVDLHKSEMDGQIDKVSFFLGNPFLGVANANNESELLNRHVIVLKLDVDKHLNTQSTFAYVKFQVRTTSEQKPKTLESKLVMMKIRRKSSIKIFGISYPTNLNVMSRENETGGELNTSDDDTSHHISHKYILVNSGPSNSGPLDLMMSFPLVSCRTAANRKFYPKVLFDEQIGHCLTHQRKIDDEKASSLLDITCNFANLFVGEPSLVEIIYQLPPNCLETSKDSNLCSTPPTSANFGFWRSVKYFITLLVTKLIKYLFGGSEKRGNLYSSNICCNDLHTTCQFESTAKLIESTENSNHEANEVVIETTRHTISTNINFFRSITNKDTTQHVIWWWVVVLIGCILGLVILSLIVFTLKKMKFFERKRRKLSLDEIDDPFHDQYLMTATLTKRQIDTEKYKKAEFAQVSLNKISISNNKTNLEDLLEEEEEFDDEECFTAALFSNEKRSSSNSRSIIDDYNDHDEYINDTILCWNDKGFNSLMENSSPDEKIIYV